MKRLYIYFLLTLNLLPLVGCKEYKNKSVDIDNKSYINDFELLQQNSINDTRIKIISPKAEIDSTNNDIKMSNSLIQILNSKNQDIQVKSGQSKLNNSSNLISVYQKVVISPLDNDNFLINTNSLDWDLKSSFINLNSPLDINFENTKITSSYGSYDIGLNKLKINNNIFNRTISNKNGKPAYHIKILADKGIWLNENNSLEFSSTDKQVETTIDFLITK